jgi:hypothetical protein
VTDRSPGWFFARFEDAGGGEAKVEHDDDEIMKHMSCVYFQSEKNILPMIRMLSRHGDDFSES